MNAFGFLLLRLAVGIGCGFHGYSKLFEDGIPNMTEMITGWGWPVPVFWAWAAGLSEFIGGILIVLGLYTRWAAGAVAVVMAVALWQVHPGLPWDPEVGGELAFLYLAAALTFLLAGPGSISVDGDK